MESRTSSSTNAVVRLLKRASHVPRWAMHRIRCFPARLREARAWSVTPDDKILQESCDGLLEDLASFVSGNAHIGYALSSPISAGKVEEGNYVGAQPFANTAILVPNAMDTFALIRPDESVEHIPFCKVGNEGSFRWTGGAIWKGLFVCFPRTSNDLLVLDLEKREAKTVGLDQGYEQEHHYGGVLYRGKIYQPPRNEDHILCTDLQTMKSYRIPLAPKVKGFKARYCGSVLHPNGLIYFLPENGRVIEFDPSSEQFRFIGKPVNALAFGAALTPDGCLYSFSAYGKGILRLDPKEGIVEMLRADIGCPGAYGTRLGVNGKLYSVPGDGDFVYEFDPITADVKKLCSLGKLGAKAKCAGSATLEDGTLVFAPAFEPDAYLLRPDLSVQIPERLYDLFNDCY